MWFFIIVIVSFRTRIRGRGLDMLENRVASTTFKNRNQSSRIKGSFSQSFLSESSLSNKEKVWLHHRRLGHLLLELLKLYFLPYLRVWMLMIFIMKCVNLPNTNVYLFQLVIKEVLFLFISFIVKFGVLLLFLMFLGQNGLSFIDDCTRITWIFLLKQKSNVSIVPQNFCSMIKN